MANFEEHLTQLEKVVEKLERGDLSLDESVRLFEDGMKLTTACKQELEQAEGRIRCWWKAKPANYSPPNWTCNQPRPAPSKSMRPTTRSRPLPQRTV